MFPHEAILRPFFVLYYVMVEKAESPFGTSTAGVEYIRTVLLCSPLFRFVFLFLRLVPRLVLCVPWGVSYRLGVSLLHLVAALVVIGVLYVSFCLALSLAVRFCSHHRRNHYTTPCIRTRRRSKAQTQIPNNQSPHLIFRPTSSCVLSLACVPQISPTPPRRGKRRAAIIIAWRAER